MEVSFKEVGGSKDILLTGEIISSDNDIMKCLKKCEQFQSIAGFILPDVVEKYLGNNPFFN